MDQKADFGGICGAFVAEWEPGSSSWRTRQKLLRGGYQKFLGRWPREGGMRNGSCWARPTLAPRISANGCGFWVPTPTCQPDRNFNHKNKYTTSSGTVRVKRADGRTSRAGLSATLGGKVSPNFVEYLMGFPDGWTALSPLEMGRFHEWQRRHSPYFGTDCTRALDSE